VPRAHLGLALLVATALVGRFFCSYVCPLGAILDFLDPLLFRRVKRRTLEADARLRNVKYVVLIVFIAAALAGSSLVYLLDPIALLTRTYTLALFPPFVGLVNLVLDAVRPVAEAMRWMNIATLSYAQPVFYMSLVTFVIFAGIIALGRLAPRFWCRYLCPLGALLSLVSPLGRLRREVGPECRPAARARRRAPWARRQTRAAPRSRSASSAERVWRMPQDVIAFPASPRWLSEGVTFPPGSVTPRLSVLRGRRRGNGLRCEGVAVRGPAGQAAAHPAAGRPPRERFPRDLHSLRRVHEVLPHQHPAAHPVGERFGGLWTPKLDLRFAACEQECNVCGKVCPTQAIRSLTLEEKTHAKVRDRHSQKGDVSGLGTGQALPDLRRDLPLRCHRVPDYRRLPPPVRDRVAVQRVRLLRAALSGGRRIGHRGSAHRPDPAANGVLRRRGQEDATGLQAQSGRRPVHPEERGAAVGPEKREDAKPQPARPTPTPGAPQPKGFRP